MSNKYDANSIQILEGLDAVRKRPGMYIGSVDGRGLHHLVWEIVDNSIDEVINGYGNRIAIQINKDNSITVEDNGRGMPIGKHQSGKSALEVIFTVLHAGGKFTSEGGYKVSGGLHGVGASVVNALSEWLEVEVFNGKEIYKMRFEDGGRINSGLIKVANTTKHGSKVTFLPNSKIFQTTIFSFHTIAERIQEEAFLLKDIEIDLKDLRNDKHVIYKYDDGLKSFMEYLNKDKKVINENPFKISGEIADINIDICMQYTDNYQENIHSFVNLVRTYDGGTHEVGFKSALTKCINDYARERKILKDKDKNFEGGDIREGLTAIISLSIPENLLQFEGQTKGKLGTPIARNAVESLINDKLIFLLQENVELSELIISKVQKAAIARAAARKAKEEARSGKKNPNKIEKILSGKLAHAQSKDSSSLELFLVEGDSAGGSAKQGRDSKFQAILPLKGKVLNTEKAKLNAIIENEELNVLIHAIGAGFGPSFDINDIKYNKVIIMTDADTDGAHIQILLLTFFYRYMRELIENGHVYLALPPLFKLTKNKEVYYLYDEVELEEKKKTLGKCDIQRYKGLGEMNAEQLWDTTMDPSKRKLIKVEIQDLAISDHRINVLMGDDSGVKREWIEENVIFTLEDDYR